MRFRARVVVCAIFATVSVHHAQEIRIELEGANSAIAFGDTPTVVLQRTPSGELSVDAPLQAAALSAGAVELQAVTFGGELPEPTDTDLETVIGSLMERIAALEGATTPVVYESCADVAEPGFHYLFPPGFTGLRRLWCDEDGYTLVATIAPGSTAHVNRGMVANSTAAQFLAPGSFAGEKLSDAEINELIRADGAIYRLTCGGVTTWFNNIPFDSETSQYCSIVSTSGLPGSLCRQGNCVSALDSGLGNGPLPDYRQYFKEGTTGCTSDGVSGLGGELWVKETSPPVTCK